MRRHEDSANAVLGRRIQELRRQRDWSQETLSEESGLDRSYIAGIEVGRRNPSVKALQKLAGAFGVRIAALFE